MESSYKVLTIIIIVLWKKKEKSCDGDNYIGQVKASLLFYEDEYRSLIFGVPIMMKTRLLLTTGWNGFYNNDNIKLDTL